MSEPASIVIIEDDADINEVVAVHLRRNGFACTQAFPALRAAAAFRLRAVRPRDHRSWRCRAWRARRGGAFVRARGDMPVIVMSARTTAADKVALLKLGADDYLTKPFDLDELLARVQVQLRHADVRRASASGAPSDERLPEPAAAAAMRYKDWTLDVDARTLSVQGEPVRLTRLEFNILEALVRRPRKVFTKRELFEIAWNEESTVEEKAINVHVSNIRSSQRRASLGPAR